MITAVIPARGGSKGIPRKNMLMIGGSPLIFHSIYVASEAKSIDNVVVSSDDDEILEYAKSFGAITIRRSEILSNDKATTEPVIRHAIDSIGLGIDDHVILLQPTSPLRDAKMVDTFVNRYKIIVDTGQTVTDSPRGGRLIVSGIVNTALFTAHRERYYHWSGSMSDGYSIDGNDFRSPRMPKQRVGDNYRENGSMYITSVWNWVFANRFGDNPYPMLIPPICGIELDHTWQIPILDYIMTSYVYKKELEEWKYL